MLNGHTDVVGVQRREQRIRMRAEQGTATQLTINRARMAFVRLGDA